MMILIAILFVVSIKSELIECESPWSHCVNISFPCSQCEGTSIQTVVESLDDNGNHTIYLVGNGTLYECVTINKETPEDFRLPNTIRPYPGHSIQWKPTDKTCFNLQIQDGGWWEVTGDGGYLEMNNHPNSTGNIGIVLMQNKGQILRKITFRNYADDEVNQLVWSSITTNIYGVLFEELTFDSTIRTKKSITSGSYCSGVCEESSFTQEYGEEKRFWFRNNKFMNIEDTLASIHFKEGTVEGNYFTDAKLQSVYMESTHNYGLYIYNNVFHYSSGVHKHTVTYHASTGDIPSRYGTSHFRFYNNLVIDETGTLDSLIRSLSSTIDLPKYPLLAYNNVVYSTTCIPLVHCWDTPQVAHVLYDYNHLEGCDEEDEAYRFDASCDEPINVFESVLGFNSIGPINFTQEGDKPFPYYGLLDDLPGMQLASPSIDGSVWSLPKEDYLGGLRAAGYDNRTSKGAIEFSCPSPRCTIGVGRLDCQMDSCGCVFPYFGDSYCEFVMYDENCFHGDTVPSNSSTGEYICSCLDHYYGIYCNISECFGVLSNFSESCGGFRGECTDYQSCSCIDGYYGERCNVSTCFGIFSNITSNDTYPCSNHGSCTDYNHCDCQNEYFGEECNITMCFGVIGNDTDNTCSTHGECVSHDVCDCHPDYNYAENCNITKCHNIFSNSSAACSNHGTCIAYDHCLCEENYYDVNCNHSTCFGHFWNETSSVCSGHGTCTDYNACECEDYYNPPYCNSSSCFGVPSNSSDDVCFGHGACVELDRCSCDPDYFGIECNVTTCFGYFSNTTDETEIREMCSKHGTCSSGVHDACVCQENYFGFECNVTYCYGHLNNVSSEVCSGHGECSIFDQCNCTMNYTHDPDPDHPQNDCSTWQCEGVYHDDDYYLFCTGHGNCSAPDTCDCAIGYDYTSKCSDWYCFDYFRSDEEHVCDGHGTCVDIDDCECESEDYTGEECDIFTCFNVSSENDEVVCDGHGYCLNVDDCLCTDGFYGNDPNPCRDWDCFGVHRLILSSVCSGMGVCYSPDKCECLDDYEGNNCETYSCGVDWKLDQTCSGHGDCEGPNRCSCDSGYEGLLCEKNMLYYYVMTPILSVAGTFGILGLLGFVVCVCMCCVCCVCLICCLGAFLALLGVRLIVSSRKLDKFGRLRNVDLLLREQEADEDSSIAHIRIKQDLYQIPFEEIKVDKILGEGGSLSVVFKAFWKNRIVAFKCFKTRHLCSDQDSYDEFEREVEILASVSHPHVIQFFGATMNPPRVGIVMEFCEHGDLDVFIDSFKEKYGISYPMSEKIRMMHEVISALDYLHSRNIIHRDIKLENVLVDSQMSCKLMDFGLSRMVENMDVNKTKNIGTSFYMSPEIVLGDDYTEKCDVFSFAIFIWILITENKFPYGSAMNVENRVANNPKMRPSIEKLRKSLPTDESLDWIVECCEDCWDHDPDKRWSFSRMSDFFSENHESIKKVEEGLNQGVKFDDAAKRSCEGGKEEEELEEENERLKDKNRKQKKEIEKLKKLTKTLEMKLKKFEENDSTSDDLSDF